MDIETSKRICGMLSYLLQYPDDDWQDWLYAARLEAEEIADADLKRRLLDFLDAAERMDLETWQDQYVRTFDFGKKTNLYLTYSDHGEERERGPALIALKRQYEEAGYTLAAGGELPDYLPLMLEFASVAAWPAAESVLAGHRHALLSIHRELTESGSPYAALFELLLRIAADKDRGSERSSGREVH